METKESSTDILYDSYLSNDPDSPKLNRNDFNRVVCRDILEDPTLDEELFLKCVQPGLKKILEMTKEEI